MNAESEFQVLLFYKYVTVEDPEALAAWVRTRATGLGLTGRVIIAEEGVNATLEGTVEDTESFIQEFKNDERFSDMSVKRSGGTGTSFPKLSVKVRPEIVGTRFPKETADPRVRTAPRITAGELRAKYENQEDFVVVDMRNDYEYRSGHFKGAINPELEASRDLPQALPKLEPYKHKKVITVCTGGIRCEKMSAFLLSHGFEDVEQLEDGIHGYMEKYPGQDFVGTLYTFDQRLTMDFGGARVVVGRCYLCENPTELYVNCANDACHLHFLACDACQEDTGTFCGEACRKTAQAILTYG
ncbi:MAG: rhodanese-related sulfurtransferase [Patescibacteria group bacterium]